MLQYENFPALQTLVLDSEPLFSASRLANLTAANKIASKPSQPVRIVEVQCTVNGVSFALTARVNESKTEVTVAVKRTAGEYASFGERRDRDVSLPVLHRRRGRCCHCRPAEGRGGVGGGVGEA